MNRKQFLKAILTGGLWFCLTGYSYATVSRNERSRRRKLKECYLDVFKFIIDNYSAPPGRFVTQMVGTDVAIKRYSTPLENFVFYLIGPILIDPAFIGSLPQQITIIDTQFGTPYPPTFKAIDELLGN